MTKLRGFLICVGLYTVGTLLLGASITAGVFVFHVGVVPLIFKYSKSFRRNLIFANFVQWPMNSPFEEPSRCGVDGARNLNIEYQSKVDRCKIKLGIWHILPKTVYERLKSTIDGNIDKEELNKILDNELVHSKTPIILYCHGNSNCRAASHRLELYQVLRNLDFHIIAFDYRGYGDSTNTKPSELGVVEDALVVYEWLQSTVDHNIKPPIFVWGHSLGTGISSHFLGRLPELSQSLLDRGTSLPLPNGLILEAPFNNLADEVAKHPLSKLVAWLPYYRATFVAPFENCEEQTFKSDEYLSTANKLPILILHAKDDYIVPYVVGLKLYQSVLKSRSKDDADIKLHAFDEQENLGHKYICRAKNLNIVLQEFISSHV